MNFGWDLTRPGELDTAVHEIGHTLGFPHEHQNPYAGIVCDEEAVHAALSGPPNNWSREKTYYNIIRKIAPDMVQGSSWDPDSIMHYAFSPGLIKRPEQYFTAGLWPKPGLSARDKEWVRRLYPTLEPEEEKPQPGQSRLLQLAPGEQRNFVIEPKETRYYTIATFGDSDTVIVLFEERDGEPRYVTADDDSGYDYNAQIRVRLVLGRRYILRVRLYYSERPGETAIMMW